MRLSVTATVMFAFYVIVGEIITFELSKCSRFESLIFKKSVKVMRYNIAEYDVGRIFLCPTR